MQFEICAVGRVKEAWMREGIAEYCKRLSATDRVEIREVADEPTPERASAAEREKIIALESERLQKRISPDAYVIALDSRGKNLSSEELAAHLAGLALAGRSRVCFLIGGSLGLSETLKKQADLLLSFGNNTFPHQLARIILLEQIYRSGRINRGEPYHK